MTWLRPAKRNPIPDAPPSPTIPRASTPSLWRREPPRQIESMTLICRDYPGYELYAGWAVFRDGVYRRVYQPKRVYAEGIGVTIGELMPRTSPARAAEELEEYIREAGAQ